MTHPFFVLVFTVALMLMPWLCNCSAPTSAQSVPIARAEADVTTAAVAARSLPRSLTLTGTLIANRESRVAADSDGKIAVVEIERGQRVRKGAALAVIDPRQLALLAEEARTAVASANTRSQLAKSQCDRATRLYQMGAINQAEYDDSKAQCDDAALGVDAAAVRQRLASKNLRDVMVRAPFDGVVAERLVNTGEYVHADTTIATIVQLDPLRLELSVPEDAVAHFTEGADVSFGVAAFPGETFRGQVRYLGAAVRRATRDLLVEAVVPNPDQRLRPGMFATAEVKLGTVTLPVVPKTAVRSDERAVTDRVLVVAGGKLEERLVHVGITSADSVAIHDGLHEGERVVLAPSDELQDGMVVRD